MRKNYSFCAGVILVSVLTLYGLLATFFVTPSHLEMDLTKRFLSPSYIHWMGTDQKGVDVLLTLGLGASTSLMISLCVVVISLIFGLLLGSIAGWFSSFYDHIIMSIVDFIFAFPGFLLILALAAFFQSSGFVSLIFILSLTTWASFARLVRGEILHIKEKDYILTAKASGASSLRVLFYYIWPNLIGPLLVQATFTLASIILIESSLSFLGVGVSPDTPSWGNMLNSGRNYLLEAPHLSLFPGTALLLLVLGFNLMGEGLRVITNPHNN